MVEERAPQAVVISGPNGAGKTSVAPELLRDTVGIDAFVNADAIAEGLSAFDPDSAAIRAGRILLDRLAELAARRRDLAFESTLAGRSVRRRLTDLLRMGYDVHVWYLWLPSVEIAVARVRRRVDSGGHAVPETVIRRRFSKSLSNFYRIYRPLATTWRVYDGSALGRLLVAHGEGDRPPVVMDEVKWKQMIEAVEEAS